MTTTSIGGDNVAGARAILKVVDGGGETPSLGNLLDFAMEPLPATDAETVMVRAGVLAHRTVELMRAQGDAASLASVTLVIGDQRLKVAFLEVIGEYIL